MPSWHEIQSAVTGAWQMLHGDASGAARFETSIDAFWRSFFAIALVAPMYLVVLLSRYRLALTVDAASVPGLSWFVMVESAAYVLGWVSYPALMVFLARTLGLGTNYIRYIIVHNWATFLVIGLVAPPIILLGFGVIGPVAAFAFSIGATFITLWYRWFLASTVLQAPPVTAAGLVVVELLLGLVISAGAVRFHSG